MRKFDTKVQHLKYKVLREVAKQAWNDKLAETAIEYPPMQAPASFNLDAVKRQVEEAIRNRSGQ